MHAFSLVVCRHPSTGLWLAVEENKFRGWWLPGGFVECGDDHFDTAIKETQEEAGIDVTLKGILRVENSMTSVGGRQRVVFYAEPADPGQKPKDKPDRESRGARWMGTDELKEKSKIEPPEGLRGTELLDWARYIEGGGTIYPLDLLTTEEAPVPEAKAGRS
uniref:Nudix hydrolase domain-containing protein n=1 Tax=Pseudictyota dubia TaxID=2749911 RepID=A0A7R9VTH8_9STRA|mmetsp:Transcript_22388/g.41731  ORF Transcript_22388/g.41731 Transcript_22388/m.41731 type:complete len:162 (+) Transcript_22388:272-757(+)